MILETERVIIREFVHEDVPAVHLYASDPLVATHMIWGPNTEEETRAYISRTILMQKQDPRNDFEFAAVLKEEGLRLIGGCGIHVSEPSQGEIGYCFHPRYWGNGYASECAAALLEFGFQQLGLHRIYATCRPANLNSAKVMQRAGMTYEGHLRGHMRHKGKWHDSLLYSMLEDEFKSRGTSLSLLNTPQS